MTSRNWYYELNNGIRRVFKGTYAEWLSFSEQFETGPLWIVDMDRGPAINTSAEGKRMNYATKTLDAKTYMFNTGRLYAENGQIIGVHVIDTETVYFSDVTRGIDGLIRHDGTHEASEHFVLRCYDNNNYENYPSIGNRYELRDLFELNAETVAIS